MRSDGSYVFGDLVGKVDVVRVTCDKCYCEGSYSVQSLIDKHGPDCKVNDLLNAITVDCAKNRRVGEIAQCCAQWPDLIRVFVD
jgi:hypothetical protein